MSDAKFTPGPWIFDPNNAGMDFDAGYGIYTHPYVQTIVHVPCSYRTEQNLGAGVAEANAHLIAAAPDMYQMLKTEFEKENCTCGLLRFVGEFPPCDTCKKGALIAKAEGR